MIATGNLKHLINKITSIKIRIFLKSSRKIRAILHTII